MKKRLLFLACLTLIFLAWQLKIAMASNLNETANSTSPLLNVTRLPDGTLERHYANGTVMHDYFVTLQFHTAVTWNLAVKAVNIILPPPLKPPDDPTNSDNPFARTQVINPLLFAMGAAAVIDVLKKHKSLSRLPNPVENSL